jgi:phenylalanyl-tRNA synthetase alpha chain
MNIDVKNLHPLEIRILLLPEGDLTVERMAAELSFNTGQSNQAMSWLLAKGFVEEVARAVSVEYELTELGEAYRTGGTPEERMLSLLAAEGPMTLPEICAQLGIENKDAGSSFGILSREGILRMDPDKRVSTASLEPSPRMTTIRSLLERGKRGPLREGDLSPAERETIAQISKKRGAATAPFRAGERETLTWRVTSAGREAAAALRSLGVTGQEEGALTAEMLSSGSWRGKRFRPYNVDTPPSRVSIGRKNPYCEFLTSVKNKLVSLGFEEFDGPLVETEFWNSDALFMPQFHSARDIHDVYYIAKPTHAREIEQPYLDRVAEAHETGGGTGSRGWMYSFDRDFTRRLILRSHGTVLSAKTLPTAKVPGKYFGVVRCFRYDQVEPRTWRSLPVRRDRLGEDVNLRTLLGLLRMFAEEVAGATEVKYAPAYFPFTEPSIEVHIKHPVLGWFELGGSGIFRPEVTKPLGVDVPVLAWGLGIDRMALMTLGLNDLRELFTGDIDSVRMRTRR